MTSLYRPCLSLIAGIMTLGAYGARAEVAVQYHCAGATGLANADQLPTLHKVLALPSTANFQAVVLARFSSLVASNLELGTNSALIEPLLRDVLEKETVGEFSGSLGHAPSFILAVHLDAARMQLWQDALTNLFGGGGEVFSNQSFNGRRWDAGGTNSFWLVPAKDWLLAGHGEEFSAAQADFLGQIKARGRPVPAMANDWLQVELSSSALGGWFRLLKPAHIRIAVTPNGDDLHVSGRVQEEEATSWKSGPWQIPKDLMRGQIISFTAGQNVAAYLKMNPALSRMASNPLTNQFYCWALDQMPLLNYMAWPVADASNALARLSAEVPAALNPQLKRFNGSQLTWDAHANKMAMVNMGMFVPVLEAVQDSDGQFLFLSTFPRSLTSKLPPEGLLAQIQGRTNVVYYDWELTGPRLSEYQMLRVMVANRVGSTNAVVMAATEAESQWINGLGQLAHNTVTEITRVSPTELSIERQAPIGFTAMELVLMADWICDANAGQIHAAPGGGSMMQGPGGP